MKARKVVLSDELFQEISNDKTKMILAYKNESVKLQEQINTKNEILNDLYEQRAILKKQIAENKKEKNITFIKKLVVRIKSFQQRRLATRLSKLVNGEAQIIKIDRFYPENKVTKKR